jgi:hypothetical protein
MAEILNTLNVKVPDVERSRWVDSLFVSESTWAEDAQEKTIETIVPDKTPEFFATYGPEASTPMGVKTECRKMLAASGFTERGFDLVTVYEQNLASLGSSMGWDRLDGTGPLALSGDCGYTPYVIYSMFGYWMVAKWKHQALGQVEQASKCLAMAAYCKTLAQAACPGRTRREGDPTVEELSR